MTDPDVAGQGPDRRSEILDLAAEIFSKKGYRVSTLNDIADRLGVTRAALYYYFASKQEILTAIMDDAGRALLEAVRAQNASGLPPSERLRRIIRSHVHIATEHRYVLGVYLAEKGSLTDEDRAAIEAGEREYVRAVADTIEEGVAAGEFAPVPAQPAAMLLMGMVSWTPRWFQTTGDLTCEGLADLIYALFAAGLRQGWEPAYVASIRK